VTLERETLHIMDDQQRIALVETKTTAGSLLARARSLVSAPKALIRYQFDNHLGSASLELDGNGQVISYEEYTPYGSTSYQAVRSQIETPKRYRYTGKERDEESGLYYHGARHYVPWLGRWCSCDPSELREGTNLYQYVLGQPTIKIDADGYSASNAQIAQILKENQAAAMVQGKLIPEFPSINEYPELKASAQKAAIETIESAGIKGGIIDPDKLYETFRRRLFTQWRRMIRAKGANPIKSLFSIGKGNQLQFRKGPFKGQRVNLHHSVTRAQIRELNLPPELAIDPDNLTPQGESFHQKRAHPDITETTKVREGTVPERKQALKKLRSSVSSKGAKVISTLKGIAPNIAGVIIDLSAAKAADILQSNEPLTEENIEFMRNWGYTYEGFNEQSQTTPEFRYEPSLLQRMGNKIYLFFRILTDAPFTKSLLEAGEQYGDPNLS
jgi:RHS repeat-associated protein